MFAVTTIRPISILKQPSQKLYFKAQLAPITLYDFEKAMQQGHQAMRGSIQDDTSHLIPAIQLIPRLPVNNRYEAFWAALSSIGRDCANRQHCAGDLQAIGELRQQFGQVPSTHRPRLVALIFDQQMGYPAGQARQNFGVGIALVQHMFSLLTRKEQDAIVTIFGQRP